MIYIKDELLNQNYEYYYNNNYFIIRTNKNCYTNYNTTYCDCFNMFQNNGYLVSSSYSCTQPSQQYRLNYNELTNDFYYRNDIDSILICFAIIVCFGFGIPFYLLRQFLKVV